VYGPESSGKTNITYCAIANAQRLPPPCNVAIFVDLEGTFDPKWAAQFGVDVDKLLVVKPGYGEEAVDLIDALIRAEEVAILVVDSLAVVVAAKEIEGSTEKADVGSSAVLVKRLVNKLAIVFSMESRRGHTPCVILLNQTRFKIGVMFGDPETIPGGQAMKFNSSLTIRLYGKNKVDTKIHPDLPVYKDTNLVVKKAKVPVRAIKTQYDMAMMATDKLSVGQSASFGSVKGHLQMNGTIVKVAGGYEVAGTHYSKIGDIEDHYYADPVFRNQLQQRVMDSLGGEKMLVEAEGHAAK
jgi:recombination protein RecA